MMYHGAQEGGTLSSLGVKVGVGSIRSKLGMVDMWRGNQQGSTSIIYRQVTWKGEEKHFIF
jgi:hypothetical protein